MVIVESCYVGIFFFFFQAEDGIRDIGVTGVQTCALPIFAQPHVPGYYRLEYPLTEERTHLLGNLMGQVRARVEHRQEHPRSEERRVGKKCRSRWSPYH